jgi:N-acylneuraminate cytidylyltransferase
MRTLAVIAARAGSKGLPKKNIRTIAGLPLIAHAMECAKRVPSIMRTIVSTDGDEIANVARDHGGDVPFLRPPELATDTASIIDVLQYTLARIEREESSHYDALMLLEPTSPGRLPEDLSAAIALLQANPDADGVVGCSEPMAHPFWTTVVEKEGFMASALPQFDNVIRRQELPRCLRINGGVYVWRTGFLRTCPRDWKVGRYKVLETPEERAFSIDTLFEFEIARLAIESGLVKLPWLDTRSPMAS